MAIEAVEITAGSGTKVGVDIVDTDKQIQYVKLMDPTDGSATAMGTGGGTEATAQRVTIASDSTGVLSVDDNGSTLSVDGTVTVGAITAGETHVGAVGGHTISVTVTPTLSINATYIANDYVGTDHTPMSFTLARVNDGSGTIIGAMLASKVVVTGSYELWLFNTTLDPGHDSDAWTITDAEQLTCIGVIPFSTWYANANGAVSMGSIGSGFPFVCIGTAKVIYACLVTRATVAWEADGDVSVKLWAIQD